MLTTRFFTVCLLACLLNTGNYALAATPLTIGSGQNYFDNPALARPFSRRPQRYQILVLNSELDAADGDLLVAIAFNGQIDADETATFRNVALYICPTAQSTLQHNFAANYTGQTPVQVFSAPEFTVNWTQKDWQQIVFDQPFRYDGKSNLIIEIQHAGGDAEFKTTRWTCEPGRILDGNGRVNDGPTAAHGELRSYFNGLRVYVERAVAIP